MKCKGKMDPNIMTKLGISGAASPARPQTMGGNLNNTRESVRSQSPPYKPPARGPETRKNMRTSVQPASMSMKVSAQEVNPMRQTQPPRMTSSSAFKSNKAVGIKGNKSRTVKTAQSQQNTQMGAIKAKKDMD